MVGTAAISAFGGITSGLIMVVLGLPLAIPIAVIGFFAGFIPYIGSFITTALALMVTLTFGTTTDVIVMLIFTVVFNIAQGNFVTPIVYGKSLSLHPAIVLMAIPVGNEVAGVLGMFLVVPAAAMVAATWRLLLTAIDATRTPPGPDEPAPWPRPLATSFRPPRTGPAASRLNLTASGVPAATLDRVTQPIRSVSAQSARRFLVTRHLLAPPRSLPAGARVRDAGHGPARVAPVRPDRRRGSQPRPDAAVADRRLPPPWTDDLLYRDRALYETYNKMLSIVPTAELPWYRLTWDRSGGEHERDVRGAPRPR